MMNELFQTNEMKGQKMNETEINDRQSGNMEQNEENAMNDLQNGNSSGDDAASNNDASHKGDSMDINVNPKVNDTGHDEVSESNNSTLNIQRGGENMELKKRTKYDGSYAHGVTADVEHVSTMIAYSNAVDRLEKRRSFLVGEYKAIQASYMATEDVGERAGLLKAKATKESQLKAVIAIRNTLSAIKGEIEESERKTQAGVEFNNYDS